MGELYLRYLVKSLPEVLALQERSLTEVNSTRI